MTDYKKFTEFLASQNLSVATDWAYDYIEDSDKYVLESTKITFGCLQVTFDENGALRAAEVA